MCVSNDKCFRISRAIYKKSKAGTVFPFENPQTKEFSTCQGEWKGGSWFTGIEIFEKCFAASSTVH